MVENSKKAELARKMIELSEALSDFGHFVLETFGEEQPYVAETGDDLVQAAFGLSDTLYHEAKNIEKEVGGG